MTDPADHPLQGGEPHLRNIGPGDDDYGRTPKSWNVGAPLIDQYKAGPCPTCGEFAIGAERRPDGFVNCRNNHKWLRKYVGCDMAKPGEDTNVEHHTISVTVAFIKRVGDPTCQMRVTVPGATGEPVAMAVNMAAYPTDEERKALVACVATAARTGINNVDFKIRNPVVADIVDRFFQRMP
jgi:hypothetical protein